MESKPSTADVAAVVVELVVLELDPIDVMSAVLTGRPVLDSVDDVVVLVGLVISVTECEMFQREFATSDRYVPPSVDAPAVEIAGVVLAVILVSALVEKSVPDKRLVDVVLVLLETLVDVTC